VGLFKDEKKSGAAARETAALEGEGGSARELRKRGTLYDAHTVKSTSFRNLKDAIDTLRQGR
jgi:hypothetical protein